MSVSNPFVVGDLVNVSITRAGGANERVVGRLLGIVVASGIELNVSLLINDEQDREDVEDVLAAAGGDVRLEDLRRSFGSYVLENCQPEDCSIVPVGLLPREVYEHLRVKWTDEAALLSAVEARLGVRR